MNKLKHKCNLLIFSTIEKGRWYVSSMCPEKVMLHKIEELRSQLVTLVAEKGYTNRETVNVSQQLDQLLNEYNYLRQKRSGF